MKSQLPPSIGDIDARIVIGCQILRAATPEGQQRSLDEIAWVCGVSVSTITRIYKDGLAKAKALLAVHNIKEINET